MDGFLARQLGGAILLSLPLVLSASLHMVIVRRRLLQRWATPLSISLFGKNKTWRGFLVMTPLTAFATVLVTGAASHFGVDLFRAELSPLALGGLLGLAYCLAELPNSFLKRRLGTREGELSPRWPVFFAILDQADSALGCALVYAIYCPSAREFLVAVLLLGPAVHLLGNWSLFRLGVRARPL